VLVAELVTTTQAARELGISARSLSRWVKDGALEPDLTTPGGHYRWEVGRLRQQLRELRKQDDR
jgi:DNA-binding transcriptional MerR regulator